MVAKSNRYGRKNIKGHKIEPIVSIKNLYFSYNNLDYVLEDVNVDIYEKDFLGIIGPNGGGKSTLLKILLKILSPSKGEIKTQKDVQQNIGYVPQNIFQNRSFPITAFEAVLTGFISRGIAPLFIDKTKKDRAFEILEKLKISNLKNRKIDELSGGQRQKVFIARALCSNPKIILLDEPTSGIDIKGQDDIMEILQELNQKLTVVIVSHNIESTIKNCTKVAYVNKNLHMHKNPKKQIDLIFKNMGTQNSNLCQICQIDNIERV